MQLWQAFSDLLQLSLAYRSFWCPPLTSSRLGPVYTISWPQLASPLISLASCSLLWPGSGLLWPFYSVHTTLVSLTSPLTSSLDTLASFGLTRFCSGFHVKVSKGEWTTGLFRFTCHALMFTMVNVMSVVFEGVHPVRTSLTASCTIFVLPEND